MVKSDLVRGRNYQCINGCYAYDPDRNKVIRIVSIVFSAKKYEFEGYKYNSDFKESNIIELSDNFNDKFEIFEDDFLKNFKMI